MDRSATKSGGRFITCATKTRVATNSSLACVQRCRVAAAKPSKCTERNPPTSLRRRSHTRRDTRDTLHHISVTNKHGVVHSNRDESIELVDARVNPIAVSKCADERGAEAACTKKPWSETKAMPVKGTPPQTRRRALWLPLRTRGAAKAQSANIVSIYIDRDKVAR